MILKTILFKFAEKKINGKYLDIYYSFSEECRENYRIIYDKKNYFPIIKRQYGSPEYLIEKLELKLKEHSVSKWNEIKKLTPIDDILI